MEIPIVITHNDADGIICLSLFFKKFGCKADVHFSSPSKIKKTLLSCIRKGKIGKLYVFDISADKKSLLLSSLFEKAVWIDHHIWPEVEKYKNVESFVDSSSPSASQLVGKFFGIESELIEIANQIDRNEIKSEEALFLRDLIAAIKFNRSFYKLRSLARDLAFSGIEKFEQNKNVAILLKDYYEWKKKAEEEVLRKTKVFEVNGKKVAVYESNNPLPVHIINDKLKEHQSAPFDIIAAIFHKFDEIKNSIFTKLELRSHTGKDVYKIASIFGGGGHTTAGGASVQGFLTTEKFLEAIKTL
jgi:oligoribonuclease NrnB/cAMP/cGMP phosphodiesterase (DHH superfamily)